MYKLAGLVEHQLSFLHTVNAVQEYYFTTTDCAATDYMTSSDEWLSSDYCDDDEDGMFCSDGVVNCVTYSGIIKCFCLSILVCIKRLFVPLHI